MSFTYTCTNANKPAFTTCTKTQTQKSEFKGKVFTCHICRTKPEIEKPVAAQQPQVSVTQTVVTAQPVPVSAPQIQPTVPMVTIPLADLDKLRKDLVDAQAKNKKLQKIIDSQSVKLSKQQWNASTVTPAKEEQKDANIGGW